MKQNIRIKLITMAFTLSLFLTGSLAMAQTPHDLYGRWVKRAAFGKTGEAGVSRSVVDEHGNVYVAGSFNGTLNFSDNLCTPVTYTSQQSNRNNAFLVKFDSTGKYIWSVIVEDIEDLTIQPPPQATAQGKRGTSPTNLDYANGKILFGTSNNSHKSEGAALPRKVRYTSSQGSITTLLSQTTPDDNASDSYHMQSIQVIDAATGALEAKIGDVGNGTNIFCTGTPDVYAQFDSNGNIVILHFGYGTQYLAGSSYSANLRRSMVAVYNVNTASFTTNNFKYGGQEHPSNSDGARIRRHIALPNTKQIVVHLAQDYAQASGEGVPVYYIHRYTNTFTHETYKTITNKAIGIDYPPLLSSDGNSNIYMAVNYGDSKTWKNKFPVANSNNLNGINFLFDNRGFTTKEQHNKVIVSRLNQDLIVNWAIQIGSTGTGGTDQVYCTDIKNTDEFTYVIGRFKGTNVPFGSSKTLSSTPRVGGTEADDFDGFYAVYNNSNGACVYAVKMGGSLEDRNNTLFLADNARKVLIGGSYKSPSFQVDPSNRLYPLAADAAKAQAFIALYAPDVNSLPASYKSSFGDAPASYGKAVHHAYECLRLGGLDLNKVQDSPLHSFNADSDVNDDGFTPQTNADGSLNLTHENHNLSSGGVFNIKVKVSSTKEDAKMIAWIDFNRNGVFDADEISDTVAVAQSANQQTKTLSFGDVRHKLRQGKTYMRIRLTTESTLGAGYPAGLFFNGEVEDYALTFRLFEHSKSVSPSLAKVGDTLTYTISFKNISPAAHSPSKLFDPIPRNTDFVSANPTATAENVTVGGVQMAARRWVPGTMDPTNVKTYELKVRVTGAPQISTPGDSLIYNVAYAILNGDSIPSTGAACQLAPVEITALDAVKDTVMTPAGTEISIDVLNNDVFASCTHSDVEVTLSSNTAFLKHGQATVLGDNNIKYTPNTGTFIDSLRYRLRGCAVNTRRDSATVYVAVLQSESLNYFACESDQASMKMKPISGVTYYWYRQPTGGTAAAGSPTETLNVTKDASLKETFWVEARYGTIRFPRHKIELHKLTSCGDPTIPPSGCATDGTVVWREDFGGNSATDDRVSSTQLEAGTTEYNFSYSDNIGGHGGYCLLKYNNNPYGTYWHADFSDHTIPDDKMRGYMFMADASDNINTVVYQKKIKGLCAGEMYISLWAINIMQFTQADNPPSFRIEFVDKADVVVASYTAPPVPKTLVPTWHTYGFPFTVGAGVDSLTLRIFNIAGNSGTGNDFALDDIELRLCAPKVDITQPVASEITVCAGFPINLSGTYTDNSVFGGNLTSKWQYSATGEAYGVWTDVAGSTVSTTGNTTISNTKVINPAEEAHRGYYRMIVADASRIDKPACRAASRVIYVDVVKTSIPPDIRVSVKPAAGTVRLNAYIDSLPYAYTVAWAPTALFTNATTGEMNTSAWSVPAIHIATYTVNSAACGSHTAKAYIHAIDQFNRNRTETVFICKDLPHSRVINLNRLFGLRTANGVWSYPNDATYYVTENNVTDVVSGKHAGAKLFDALKAFNDAVNQNSALNYLHAFGQMRFDVTYTDGAITKTIQIVVF